MEFLKVYLNYKENKITVHLPSGRSIEFVNLLEGLFYHYPTTKRKKFSGGVRRGKGSDVRLHQT